MRKRIINKEKNKSTKIIIFIVIIVFLLLAYYIIWPFIQFKLVDRICKKDFGDDFKAVRFKNIRETIPDEVINSYGVIGPAVYRPWICYNEKEKIIEYIKEEIKE